MSTICHRCKRPLTDPESVRAGLGPVCRGKHSGGADLFTQRTANYEVVERVPGRLVIRDLGPWDQYLTVTNAAEQVVEELHGRGLLPAGTRLYCIDSLGACDEIVHEGGRFTGFAPGV